jgi:hypothetical protein
MHAKVVSERLGHEDVAFTLQVYAHLFDEQRREAAIGIDDLLKPSKIEASSSSNDLEFSGFRAGQLQDGLAKSNSIKFAFSLKRAVKNQATVPLDNSDCSQKAIPES